MSSMPPAGAPAVTVAMITFNSAAYVGHAVRSVLAQDFRDFELLVCDDGSTDATLETIGRFDDPRIRVVRNESNLGEYGNRNQALALARGKYLMYVDGDDLVYAHGLGFLVRMLEAFPDSALAIARPWSEMIVYPFELSPREFYLCQFLGPDVGGINFAHLMFRTDALRQAGGFDRRYRSGDSHVQLLIGMTRRCLLVSDGLSWWRRTPGQASERLLRDDWLTAEATRYRLEMLSHALCPLSPQERSQARTNVVGVFLRIVARYVLRGRMAHALRLVRHSGLSLRDWRHVFSRSRRPYLKDRGGGNPLMLALEDNPFAGVRHEADK